MPDAGPPWTVTGHGVTGRGDRWVVVRRRGGRTVRITVNRRVENLWVLLAYVGHVVQSLPELPGRNTL